MVESSVEVFSSRTMCGSECVGNMHSRSLSEVQVNLWSVEVRMCRFKKCSNCTGRDIMSLLPRDERQ